MQNSYNFLIGIGLIVFITVGDQSDSTRYYFIPNNSEVTEESYQSAAQNGTQQSYRIEKSSFNYNAAIPPTGLIVGVGFLLIGFVNRKKK